MTNAFHLSPVDILSRFDELSLPSHFCIVPFTNLILNPGGKVSVCRQKGTDHYIGNLNEQSLEDIWNSEYLKKWRKEFLDGKPDICSREIENDQCHLGSGSYFYIKDVSLDLHQKNLPVKITANFNGACNLRCEMCHVWTMENGFYDQMGRWEELREKIFPYIKEIELLSGEPFIQKDTFRLIDEISAINPDCIWSFTTNGHWKLTEKIKNSLDKIIVKNIIYSIDSLNVERYNEIRKPGNLPIVLENLHRMEIYNESRTQKIALNFHFLVMQKNWDELAHIINFCHENRLMPILNYLNEPIEYSISTLSLINRKLILDLYLEEMDQETLSYAMRIVLSICHSLPKNERLEYLMKIQGRLNAS